MTSLIRLDNVTRSFRVGDERVAALAGVDLVINRGEYVAITGRSGSGKSTLLSILGMLDRPTSGSYLFDGVDISRSRDSVRAQLRNRRIGFVFQSFQLLPTLSAVDNVALPLAYAGVGTRRRRSLAEAALDRVGLGDRARHTPGQLSGGQQQRVAIARSLINNPELILADEATGNLDTATGDSVVSLLDELHREGHTVLLVTHDLTIATRAARLVVMADGRVVSDETNSVANIQFNRRPLLEKIA
jgi:putative ABC transport system ATP-binding protein